MIRSEMKNYTRREKKKFSRHLDANAPDAAFIKKQKNGEQKSKI